MSTLRYRLASVKDAGLLARLNARLVEDGADFGPADHDYLERRMRRWLSGGGNHGVLFEDARGQVVAYAVYQEFPREIYLRQFLVLPAARHGGIGREAFQLLRGSLWSADKRLTLEVMSDNRNGYRFWRSLGYRDCAMTLEIPAPCHESPKAIASLHPAGPAWTGQLLAAAAALGRSPLRLLRRLRSAVLYAGHTLGRGVAMFAVTCLLSTPVAAAPAGAGEERDASPALEAISEAELRAMRSVGACPASIYRTAWSEARRYRLDPAWVVAMIEAESSCRPDAVSSEGALGLMQLVPNSGARDAYRLVYGKDQAPAAALLRDPRTNIRLGVAYLHALRKHFVQVDSDEARLLLAIAAYNCGTGLFDDGLPPAFAAWDSAEVQRWIAQHASQETRGYVIQVRSRAARYVAALLEAQAGATRAAIPLSP